MAKYNSARYDVDVYDAGSTPLSPQDSAGLGFSGATLSARDIGNNTVRLDWRIPLTEHLERRILRSSIGYPPDPVSGQGVIVLAVDTTDPLDDNASRTTVTDVLSPGAEAFYAMFVRVADNTSPTLSRWVAIATAKILLPTEHQSASSLVRALPSAFLSENGSEISGNADPDGVLFKAIDASGRVLDSILSDADRLLNVWSPQRMPSGLVNALAAMLGLPIEPALGPKPQRALIGNGIRMLNGKGTWEGIRLLAECTSGTNVRTVRGKNLFPSVLSSGYEMAPTRKGHAVTAVPFEVTGTLAEDLGTSDGTATVTGIGGFPLHKAADGSLIDRVWVRISSPAGVEWALVQGVTPQGRLSLYRGLDITYGAIGLPRRAHASGATVSLYVSDHGWDVPPGFDADVRSVGETGFSMPAAASAVPDQPPLQSACLRLQKGTATAAPAPEIRFSPRHTVAAYERTGRVGAVTTRTPHNARAGQRVTCMFGAASAVANTAATYRVLNVIDAYRFTVLHTEDGLTDVNHTASDLLANPAPYVFLHPSPATMLPVEAGLAYTYSAYVRADTTVRTCSAVVAFYDAYGNLVGTETVGTGVADTTTDWTRVQVTATAPATAALAAVSLRWSAAWSSNEVHYVTQHQFEQASSATSYDDGGLIRLGLEGSADIDPNRVIRLRTLSLLQQYAGERPYRIEFLSSAVVLPTTNSFALDTFSTDYVWSNFDVRMRISPDTFTGTQQIVQASDTTGGFYWRLSITSNELIFRTNLSVGASSAYNEGAFGEGNFGGGNVTDTITSSSHGLSAGLPVWIRMTRDASTGAITFYKAADSDVEPQVWTQISTHSFTPGPMTAAPTRAFLVGSDLNEGIAASVYAIYVNAGADRLLSLTPTLYDVTRNVIPNPGTLGGDFVLSDVDEDTVTVTVDFL